MSGDDARVAYPLFQAENGGSIPTSPLQFKIYEISFQRAKRLNKQWHSRLPQFRGIAKVSYGAEYNGIFYAVAIWGNPTARVLPQHTWLELRRMAIASDAPKNTASRMIKIMILLIKKKFPKVTTLISYQDEEVHKGIIYKATGWFQAHRRKGGTNGQWNNPSRYHPLSENPGYKIRWQTEIREMK